MSLKCKLGFHTWNGCECYECGKIRDEQHNWQGCKCSKCGKKRDEQHIWDVCKCSKCGKTRDDEYHIWSKDCEKCFICGKTRENQHDWSKYCEICFICGKTRENQHDWSKDYEKCTKCGFTNYIKIGTQFWMKYNLNVSKFRNGDTIPEAKSNIEWVNAAKNNEPAWCYYQYYSSNDSIYGKLYNWYAVNDPRGLAPQGWRVPTDAEWTTLINKLDEEIAGAKGLGHWYSPTNEKGFTALGGYRDIHGELSFIRYGVGWWSSTVYYTADAWSRGMSYGGSKAIGYSYDSPNGFSVRCIKD